MDGCMNAFTNKYDNLTSQELALLTCLVRRFPWNIARPLISSLGLDTGHGKEKTLEKILSVMDELKSQKPNKFQTVIDQVNSLLFSQFLYGDKALYSISVDAKVLQILKTGLEGDWSAKNQAVKILDILIDDRALKSKKKNSLDLIYYSSVGHQSLALFSTVREQTIKEVLPPSNVPGFSDYDEIIAKKKIKKQCFDSLIIDFQNNKINILIDISGGVSASDSLFPKSVILRQLFHYAGAQFSSTEKDFFTLIEPICEQKTLPYKSLNYRVFDLSFHTKEGTSHKERKSDSSKDLRDDVFNVAGIKASGKIGVYRIGIRIERSNPNLHLYDNLELLIPGTLRRYLSAGKTSPVTYAIINNCITRNDFEAVTKFIL